MEEAGKPLLEGADEKGRSGECSSSSSCIPGTGGRESSSSSAAAVNPAVIFSTFIAICGSFCYGCALSYSSPAQSGIMQDLGLSIAAYSAFGSMLEIGGMIGALFCGRITALLGRKYTMWLAQIFCIIGWLALAVAQSEWWLIMGRMSMGLGVGFITYVVPVYVAEITPKESRGSFSFANQLLVTSGFAITYAVGTVASWRTLALLAIIPGIVQLIGLFFIPESPRWLANAGRVKEFRAALQYLRGKDADISAEEEEIQASVDDMNNGPKARMVDIFQRKYAYALTVGLGLMFLQQLGGNSGVAYYGSSIIEKSGFPINIGTIVMSLIQIPISAVGVALMDISGRRALLMVSAGGMGISAFLVGLSFVLQGLNLFKKVTPILTVISITGHIGSFAIGMGGIPWIIMSEIFPMSVKALAGTLVTLVNWSSSWMVTYSFNFMMQWSPAGTFFIFATGSAATVAFTWKLVPETKGRTLEEIQASMTTLR